MINDIKEMHNKFQVTEFINNNSDNKLLLQKFLKFRLDFIKEELDETFDAYFNRNDVEVLDGLIDILVVTLGTLDVFKCDTPKAWENIHNSNMSKTPGVNLTRPNNFSLPDMAKGKDFKKPDIKNYTGLLKQILHK
jgi:predicted HAD superfamily Cof-like phosphohydrolase|tara:strand:+ start:424 stop:831 length:408 start_codon:yes stop_codon:yes gene_type:complete